MSISTQALIDQEIISPSVVEDTITTYDVVVGGFLLVDTYSNRVVSTIQISTEDGNGVAHNTVVISDVDGECIEMYDDSDINSALHLKVYVEID